MPIMNLQPVIVQQPQQRFYNNPNKFKLNYQRTPNFFNNNNNNQFRQQSEQEQATEFDGKRLRKAVARKTVDYNSSTVKYLETRTWQRDFRDRRAIQPDFGYYSELEPPMSMLDCPANAITTKFVRTSTNKMRSPIFCVVWTPEGRRLITGAASGEFTLWNGLTFNFETILQAHDSPVRSMVWSHSDVWMVTGDQSGYVKYWQSNMNNVKMFQAHKESLRGISFCPTDTKFVTCSDDGTVRIWDFLRCYEERILRGHGSDVKCVEWNPQKSLIVSGSKDNQQPLKLWDPKSGQSLATIHAHKSTVMEVKWNQNGTWFLTASRDHLLKLFDIRNMSQEVQTFRGHKKEACSIAWHPIHESLFVSGGSEGSVLFWVVGNEKEVGSMEQAHSSCVWSLAWHPLGHILCSGSNDHTSKFWTRNRPGDQMRDKYNLNTMPKGQDETAEFDEPVSAIPGMGLMSGINQQANVEVDTDGEENLAIPGLDFSNEEAMREDKLHFQQHQRKVPFSKHIPRQFQQQWMENKQPLLLAPPPVQEFSGEGNGSYNGPPHTGGGVQSSMVSPSSRDHSSPSKRNTYASPHSQGSDSPFRASLLGQRPPENNQLRPDNLPEDNRDANDGDQDDRSFPNSRNPGFTSENSNQAQNIQEWQPFSGSADSDPRIGRPPGNRYQPNQEQQPFQGEEYVQHRFPPSGRGQGIGMFNSVPGNNNFENFQQQPNNEMAFGNQLENDMQSTNDSDKNQNFNEMGGGFPGHRKRQWQEPANDNGAFFQPMFQPHRGQGYQGRPRRPMRRGRGFRGRGRAF